MGSLITETPYSEITATLELLDRHGVSRADLKRFRRSPASVKEKVAKLIRSGPNRTGGVIVTVDCDSAPFVPGGWMVVEHQTGGQLTFNPSQIEFYLVGGQKSDKCIDGNQVRARLAGKPCLNANVLDYLLANPDCIPDEWKLDEAGNTRYIFFWGTVYRHRDSNLCVRYLHHRRGRWYGNHSWLSDGWNKDDPAAVCPS